MAPIYIDGKLQGTAIGPHEDLDSLITIFGSTRTVLFPFLEAEGNNIESYDETSENLTANEILGVGFSPVRHEGGIHSYFFQRSAQALLAGNDAAVYSGGSGSTDAAWSLGLWYLPTLLGTQQALMAKYDVAGVAREYQLYLNSSDTLVMEFYDESLDDGVTLTASAASAVQTWQHVVITYDGAGGTSSSNMTIAMYKDGAVDGSATKADTGGNVYEDMEDSTTPFLIGAADDIADPTFTFEGRIALPFLCGKQLTAAEANSVYSIGRRLLGIV